MIRSNRPFAINDATISVNKHIHDNRPLLLNLSAGTAVTLPAATGSGARFLFLVQTSSNANTVTCSSGDSFVGGYMQNDTGDTAGATADFFPAAAGNNKYSPTTVGGGGTAGDWFEVIDYATNKFLFRGVNTLALDPSNRFSTV